MREWDNTNFKYIVVDNGSRDSSLALVRQGCPDAIIVKLKENLGTTGAYNHGIRLAQKMGVQYVQILALDVLLAPDCLSVLTEEMAADPKIGTIGPILFRSHERGQVECMGFQKMSDWSFRPNFGGQHEPLPLPALLDVDYVDGGTSLFRVSALQRVGLMDERLFMYCEDADMGLRLKQSGYRVMATAKTRAWHRHQEILMGERRQKPFQIYYLHRNQVFLAKKHATRLERLVFYVGVLARLPRLAAYFLLRQRSVGLARVHLEALWHGLIGKMGKTKYVQ